MKNSLLITFKFRNPFFQKICLLLIILSVVGTVQAQGLLGSVGRAVKKGYSNVSKTFKKAEKDARRETGKVIHNTVREFGQGVKNVGATTKIGAKNIENEMM